MEIKTKKDFGIFKFVDLCNTELNGEMTEKRLEVLKHCFRKMGFLTDKLILSNKSMIYPSNSEKSVCNHWNKNIYLDEGEHVIERKEISVYDIGYFKELEEKLKED